MGQFTDEQIEEVFVSAYKQKFAVLNCPSCEEYEELQDQHDAEIAGWQAIAEHATKQSATTIASLQARVSKLEADATRLDFYISKSAFRLMGNDKSGWVLWDQSNGLTRVSQGKTSRETLDNAIKGEGKIPHEAIDPAMEVVKGAN